MANSFTITGKFTIKPFSRFAISFVGLFSRFKRASKVFTFTVNFYPRAPFPVYRRNSFVPGFAVAPQLSVKAICLLRAFSQIGSFVVRSITINVINILNRPLPGNKKPSNPVCVVKPVVYAYSDVSMRVNAPRRISGLTPSAPIGFPCKIASIRAIIKKLKNSGSSLFVFHHVTMSSVKTFVNRRLPSPTSTT